MKTTLAGWLLCIIALVGAGIWIGYRAGAESDYARNRVIAEFAKCTIQDAHAEKCWLPCSTDADCVQKNGQGDH